MCFRGDWIIELFYQQPPEDCVWWHVSDMLISTQLISVVPMVNLDVLMAARAFISFFGVKCAGTWWSRRLVARE